jgi:GWxTD domain-containing protein
MLNSNMRTNVLNLQNMNYRHFFSSAALLMVVGIVVSSMPIAAWSQNSLEADAIALRYDSTHAVVELEYGVLEHALSFKGSGTTWTAITSSKVEIWQNGKVAQSKDIHDTVRFSGTHGQLDSATNKLLGAMGFIVPYTTPTAAAFLWQRGESSGKAKYDTIVVPITLPDRDASKFSFGGIELASNVEKSVGKPGPFEQAGNIVTPNPSAVFGENYTKLFYYTELYVPHASIAPGQNADIVTEVVDPTGNVILSSDEKVPLAGETVPIILGLDIDGLASDSYKLRVRAKVEDAVQAEAEKSFFYSSGMKLSEEPPEQNSSSAGNDSLLLAGSDFVKMSDAELDEVIAQSMYWGTELDQKAAKKLKSLSEKQGFLFTFWRSMDQKHQSTQPLDAYRLFRKRVADADAQYNYQKTPGWKTSQGRVYITFGPPKTITNERFESGYKPYIVWQYDPDPNIRVRSGNFAEFDFVDRQGGGNYYLVSSNAIGENYDANWLTTEALRTAH